MIYLWASLLLCANAIGCLATLFNLPGNWMMIAFSAFYVWFLPPEVHPRLSWVVVGIAFALALAGEVWEFISSAAGATKQGGSRKGAFYAIIGSIVGSIVGAIIGFPLPVIGPIIAALGGGALGAFAGAYLGEPHRNTEERMAIGKGALVGRLLGTLGKFALGVVILLLIGGDSFLDW